MKHMRWLFFGVAALIPAFAAVSLASAQQPVKDLPVDQTTSYKGEEFLLIGNANRGAGEPVTRAPATQHRRGSGARAVGRPPPSDGQRIRRILRARRRALRGA